MPFLVPRTPRIPAAKGQATFDSDRKSGHAIDREGNPREAVGADHCLLVTISNKNDGKFTAS